jgi:hypothetical protein
MMRRQIGFLLVVMALASLSGLVVVTAQPPNASSKFRGEIGRPSTRTTVARTVRTAPVPDAGAVARTAAESYSVEPLPFEVGDTVQVVRKRADLFRGRRILGSVEQGQKIRVVQLRGPWVGTVAEIDGQEIGGWVWYSQIAPLTAN